MSVEIQIFNPKKKTEFLLYKKNRKIFLGREKRRNLILLNTEVKKIQLLQMEWRKKKKGR